MVKDQLSDMLTRIRNANLAFHNFVFINYTKLNLSILKILKVEGYIKDYFLDYFESSYLQIKILLNYTGWWVKKPLISTLLQISKPGFKRFYGYKKFSNGLNVLQYSNGLGIISTSIGILTHKKAMLLKKGGEFLFYIE